MNAFFAVFQFYRKCLLVTEVLDINKVEHVFFFAVFKFYRKWLFPGEVRNHIGSEVGTTAHAKAKLIRIFAAIIQLEKFRMLISLKIVESNVIIIKMSNLNDKKFVGISHYKI